MRKIEKIRISNNTMEKKNFFAPLSKGLGATRRAAMMLLVMLLTATTAWATVRTVTFTLTNHIDTSEATQATFTATGDITATYTVNLPTYRTATEASWTLGDFRFHWVSSASDCKFGVISTNIINANKIYSYWTFTISNDLYIIDNVKYYSGDNGIVRIEQYNDTKSVALTTNNYSMGGNSMGGIHSITIVYSDSPAYHITYELNGGKNAAANPEWYETATGVASLAAPTYKEGYDFGGWYDNADFNGTPVTSIAAGTTGAVTLYAKWTLHKYTINYERNGGSISQFFLTKYTVETSTYDLPTNVTRDGYYFRGWYTDADFASAVVTQVKQGSTGDKTFYAKWEKWDENGDGSVFNPWKIRNEADLRELAEKVNNNGANYKDKYFTQTEDITITGGDWTPIGTGANRFFGTYDGGGHTISGININSTEQYQGLFGLIGLGGFVQNITLVSSTITGGSNTGGIVGRMYRGVVRNCHVRSSVTVKGKDSSINCIGGVAGYNRAGTITGCTSMASVPTGNSTYLGGIVGYLLNDEDGTKGTATNCFSYNKAPIGTKTRGAIATNVERVHKVQNSDGNVTLPEDVPTTDGFLYDGVRYYKGGAEVHLVVNLTAEPGYTVTVSYKAGSDAEVTIRPDDFGDYYFTVPAENKTFTVKAAKTIDPAHFADNGDGSYTIHTATGWNVFCDCLDDNDTYNRFSGKRP